MRTYYPIRILSSIVSESISGFKDMLFPQVCVCCGMSMQPDSGMLCPFCEESGFDPAIGSDDMNCPGVILPEGVLFQYAHWKYDKGGNLQRILHLIKYGGLGSLGQELGVLSGVGFKKTKIWTEQHPQQDGYLLAVPLHNRKRRIRGYNQAELIAQGVSESTGIMLLDKEVVQRTRFTATQTGHDLKGRMNNLADAFVVREPEKIHGKLVIIVDDVFTTGATVYSLAGTLLKSGAASVGIITIAFA